MNVLSFPHQEIESRWRDIWKRTKLHVCDISCTDLTHAKKPYYNLMMFPYPSAEGLHIGNMYAFTGSDIYGRFKRMQGYSVFEPIGLDGFGIHSENYALKIGRHPIEHAARTQKKFYSQLHMIGAMYDWTRTVETYDPDYYRWTQWIFIQMFKHGLAYRSKANVNYCPGCKTVLADEQVIEERCERCGNKVENKLLEQWFFRITAYAEKLLQNSFKLDWSGKVKVAQQNWIGKSEGVLLSCKVKDLDMKFEMFDSVPQTFMAQTFTVIAPEHPKVYDLVKGTEYEKPVMDFVDKIKKKKASKRFDLEKEVEGIFTGRYLEYKPANKPIPIWVASFVIYEYGTGVVNSSAHDERDFIFAKKYGIPLHPVMFPEDPKEAERVRNLEYCYHHAPEGILREPKEFAGRTWAEARKDIIGYIEKKGWGKRSSQYHLRDWLISRQRYWGPPIPMVYCQRCAKDGKSWFTTNEAKHVSFRLRERQLDNLIIGLLDHSAQWVAGWYPVPESELPVLLPRIEDYKPGNDGIAPLAKHKEFYETICPGCGGKAVRETDVSDTFLDSSWYFLRYPSTRCTRSEQVPFDKEITKRWFPVHMYTGGAEHSVLHLMYSRFVCMVFHDWGLIDFDEPFTKFFAHGLVIRDGTKMSKSKGNIVNPDEYIARYGADALRLYLMFMGPFSEGGDFRDSAMEGMSRWVNRVWRMAMNSLSSNLGNVSSQSDVKKPLHRLIKKVTDDIEKRRYNTAIAAMMEFTNLIADQEGKLGREELATFSKLLAPFAPFLAEEIWQRVQAPDNQQPLTKNNFYSVHRQPWPSYNESLTKENIVMIAVQVNGKLRGTLEVKNQKSQVQSDIESLAKASPRVAKYISCSYIKKVIFIPGRLINFVV